MIAKNMERYKQDLFLTVGKNASKRTKSSVKS